MDRRKFLKGIGVVALAPIFATGSTILIGRGRKRTTEDVKSYLTNCVLKARRGDDYMFSQRDGNVFTHLDGYAIIPVEEYNSLVGA